MQIKMEKTDTWQIVHVQGRIDSLTASTFEESTCQFIEETKSNVVLDFANLTYISSAGLRSLLLIAKKGRLIGQEITLCGMNESIIDVIRITGFLSFFKTYPDLASALKS